MGSTAGSKGGIGIEDEIINEEYRTESKEEIPSGISDKYD